MRCVKRRSFAVFRFSSFFIRLLSQVSFFFNILFGFHGLRLSCTPHFDALTRYPTRTVHTNRPPRKRRKKDKKLTEQSKKQQAKVEAIFGRLSSILLLLPLLLPLTNSDSGQIPSLLSRPPFAFVPRTSFSKALHHHSMISHPHKILKSSP